MRPVDDMVFNCALDPPTFAMCTMQALREEAVPNNCWWWTVDVEDAFANICLGASDRPFVMFRWYHPDDTTFQGTSHDCVYVHVRGNFGPRPLPCIYTMLQLHVNIAAMPIGVSPPPAMGLH